MSEATSFSRGRAVIGALLALALTIAILQLTVVRPYLWPAGAGVALSGESVFATLSMPRAFPRLRPPDVDAVAGQRVVIERVNPALATPFGVNAEDVVVTGFYTARATRVDLELGLPGDAHQVLYVWREAYRLGTRSPVVLAVRQNEGDERVVKLLRESVWTSDAATRADWIRTHGGILLQVLAFLGSAIALVALGTRGITARLMTLTLIVSAIATAGPSYGTAADVPLIGELLLVLVWIATPLAFPIIGLAVLYFPSRAAVLDRHRWIYAALAAPALPMLAASLVSAAFLLGADAAAPPLVWIASNSWFFDGAFAAAVAVNLVIVLEGVRRYRTNRDANERRRIQMVVVTGVAAVFAYALLSLVPLALQFTGREGQLPWPVQAVLQALVLLPAFALPYAVAVRRVFSPRTVLRQSLQYALARKTLSLLIALPVVALAAALIGSRDRPLGEIIWGQPLFYFVGIVLVAIGWRFRDRAQRWLDRRFFREEYDGREILVALAGRVPYETDPQQLVAMVLDQIDSALHPESIAILAGETDHLDVLAARRRDVGALPLDGGIATLLKWSETPLEVFVDDERSQAARLPARDRAWLAASGVTLLVPVLAGSGDGRTLAGLIALGQKRSEEPYTPEDRRLLSGIAAQMSVALDLSRLRRRLSSPAPAAATSAPQATGGVPLLIESRYRIDEMIGRGGMGAVYRAHDLRLGRDVAVKVVRSDLAGRVEARQRFEREAQIVARLQHPAIVTVFDYGTLPDGAAFLVMEYVRGLDLRRLLDREGPLAADRVVPLVETIARAVDSAHQAGVLHRDLKPENILLPESGLAAKVLDFGVAKLVDGGDPARAGTVTHAATIIGTPAYMAPEQLRGAPIDGRADVYSLAVMTYEALTGRLPFGAGSIVDIGLNQAAGRGRVDLTGIPEGMTAPLLAGLAATPEERPADAIAFATALATPPRPR